MRQRTQTGQSRDDTLLAEWFSGRVLDAGADEIWSRIEEDCDSAHLRFVQWENAEDLRKKLLDVLVDVLGLDSIEDAETFEKSLGGHEYNGRIYFRAGENEKPGACGKIEDWQILSPVRNEPHGVGLINRLIQETFRQSAKKWARDWKGRTPYPMGREEIVYGDKVINQDLRKKE